ncbi:GNAT family N-acetyltransferase [Clostridium sp. AM58-1XD]|uniref:GNAT family N-acetyltransferase n=1 Tax=Clostridium sp. AM58-1XD TaxID=2292307 RepID=UPI0015F6C7EA|nr:GNAT family N-acetyltransferase [Clostridium sp. AM58-1XD]
MQGTVKMETERLILRRHEPGDGQILHMRFGRDKEMYEYSGWNPYKTEEMAQETIRHFIDNYSNPCFYGWAIQFEGQLVGTIGAYDYKQNEDRIEVGISIVRGSWGKGFASEALRRVIVYLTEEEGISVVTAWCAEENIGSRRAMEKAGMVQTSFEKGALTINEKTFGKLNFEYHAV